MDELDVRFEEMELPYVSSEGGPLIIGDHLAFSNWTGCDGDGSDYRNACDAVSLEGIGSLGPRLLVWDIGGPGTAFIADRSVGRFCLIRLWADEDFDDSYLLEVIPRCAPCEDQVSLDFTTDVAVVLWAPESAVGMEIGSGAEGVPNGDWSMGGTAYHFQVTPGSYVVQTSRLEEESLIAICIIATLQAATGKPPANKP